jgi:probable HAF family extracellular repeat protein
MSVYNFTTIDDPLASGAQTFAFGINGTDQIVGFYADKDGRYHGYIFDADSGTYTTLDDPQGTFATLSTGINDAGLVVGTYNDNFRGNHGFLYNGRTYTTLDDPLGSTAGDGTVAIGINRSGQVVGYYDDLHNHHGFLYSGGTYTTLNDPLATNGTEADGINSAGLIVGVYFDHTGTDTHGFLYNPNGGTYTTLDDPLATNGNDPRGSGTFATGINDAGVIVGSYVNNTGTHGFLYNGGIYTTLDDPGALDTEPTGINKSSHVVGVRIDKFGDHGFLEIPGPNPPPPGDTTADMILRGSNGSPSAGQYEIYDIGNNAILAGYSLGPVGTDWQFIGLGGFFGSDTTDLVLRNVNTGAFEVYDIANNTITSAAALGAVGLDWQLGGFAVDPPTASPASMADSSQVAQLVQAMAGFGGGGADDGLNAVAFGTDTSQQTFLTTSQYA